MKFSCNYYEKQYKYYLICGNIEHRKSWDGIDANKTTKNYP